MSLQLRSHIEKIVSLTDDEFNYILSHFSRKRLKKHQFLIQENTLVNYDFFVEKGLLKAYYTNEKGREHILGFALESRWRWITDYEAYHKSKPSTMNIDCLEDCQLLCISLENKQKLCTELEKMELFFRVKLNNGYAALQDRIISLLDKDAKGRYNQFVESYPTLLQRIPKTILASYLGVSRETLSRI